MLNKKLKLVTMLLLSIELVGLQAQENINATGGSVSGSGGSVSFSIGQVSYLTLTGISGTMTQGIQQPYEIYAVTAIDETKELDLSIWAFPNPTADNLTLEVNTSVSLSIQLMTYQLSDMQGKLLRSEKITSKHTSIAMSKLVPATYFVKVIDGNKAIKTFQIIKN